MSKALFSPLFVALSALLAFTPSPSQAQPLRLHVVGDSLSTGYNLPSQQSFVSALARRLRANGYGNVLVLSSAEDGNMTGDGAKKLPAALQSGADIVLLELGANDMLGDVPPQTTMRNLNWMVATSKAHGARVILAGMLAAPKKSPPNQAAFNSIYPTLAARHKVSLYPFFLEGVFGRPGMMQNDGDHPTAIGVERIVSGIFPIVERNIRAKEMERRGRVRNNGPAGAAAIY